MSRHLASWGSRVVQDSRADEGRRRQAAAKETAVGYARGVAGGLLSGMPLLMTMEMWAEGFYMPPLQMLLFFLLNYLVLFVLEYYTGFQDEGGWGAVAQDALVAYGIGIMVSALVLFAFNLLQPGMSLGEILGKITLEAIPVSIGVSIAISLLGQQQEKGRDRKKREAGFWGQQAIALGGAVVFGFNVAPTMEPVVLGLSIGWWHSLVILFLSLIQVHAIVYALDFRGSYQRAKGVTWYDTFLEKSIISYAVALLVAAYLLWTFGRLGPETGLAASLHMIVVLGFVTSLGAAAGKLIT